MSEVANAVLLSVTSSVGVFNSLLPPFSDVRKATRSDTATVDDVRMGEIAAASLVVGIGLVGSSVAKSPVPAMASVVAAGVLVCMYESVLAATPKETNHA